MTGSEFARLEPDTNIRWCQGSVPEAAQATSGLWSFAAETSAAAVVSHSTGSRMPADLCTAMPPSDVRRALNVPVTTEGNR